MPQINDKCLMLNFKWIKSLEALLFNSLSFDVYAICQTILARASGVII